jgi:MFS family permease
MFFASAPFALLPTVASNVGNGAIGYGVLVGCFGTGAIMGALVMQPARSRWSTETVASAAVALLGVTIVATGLVHRLGWLVLIMLAGGAAWIVVISLVSALVQSLAPDWVRARVMAIFMLIAQGGMAGGSAVWGIVSAQAGVRTAFLWAGLGTIATTVLGLVARLPDTTVDVSPWVHWRMPAIVQAIAPDMDQGPVIVTVEYLVPRQNASEFLRAMHRYGRVRRRDGASRWGIFRDVEHEDVYVETFLVSSWAEHLRQHERSTRADRELEDRIASYTQGQVKVRHLVYAESEQ